MTEPNDYTEYCADYPNLREIPYKQRSEIIWSAVAVLKDFAHKELIELLKTMTGYTFPTRQARDCVSHRLQEFKKKGLLTTYGHGASNVRYKLAE